MKSTIISCPKCGTKNRIPVFKQHLQPKCGRCQNKIDLHGHIKPIVLTDHDFSQFILEAPIPVMIDFYSPTCGPCRMLAPLIDAIANRYYDRLLVAKIDTSINSRSAMQYRIKGVPTLIFFVTASRSTNQSVPFQKIN